MSKVDFIWLLPVFFFNLLYFQVLGKMGKLEDLTTESGNKL
jgi:hypothetical protein